MRVGGRQRKEQPDLSALHSFNSLHFTSLMRGIFAPVMEKDFKLVTICCSHTHTHAQRWYDVVVGQVRMGWG